LDERVGGSEGRVAVFDALAIFGEIEIEAAAGLVLFDGGPGAIGEADGGETGREHQRFLAAGDGDIDAPVVHLEGQGTDAGDAIDDEQRLAGGADSAADLLEVADGG